MGFSSKGGGKVVATTKDEVSERVRKEKEALFSAPAQIDVEKTKFLLEVYKETEGQPAVIRRAKLFYKLCTEKTIYIDGNPIVGTLTKYKNGAYLTPEVGAGWLARAKDIIRLPRGEAPVTEEVREWINKAVDYWKDKNVFYRTREIMSQAYGVDIRPLQRCGVTTELTPGGVIGVVPDYSLVLNKGLKELIAEIEEEKAKLDIGNPEGLSKWHFYQAVSLCLDGMIKLAGRYASLAKEIADEEIDPKRKRELERIAETCEWVPANPARNFYEAIQSFFFTQLGGWFESPIVLTSPPVQFTRCLYPFYKKDREAGSLTEEEAIELIQFFFLKLNGLTAALTPHEVALNQSRLGEHLSVGGMTPEGEDATNEVDWLVLEAQRRIKLPEPLINLVYHNKLSEDFLLKCVDLITTGIGQPAFHDIEKIIPRHLSLDQPALEEVRTAGIVGCVQSIIPGYSDFFWEAYISIAKMVELALNNGKDALTGVQLGPQTGEAESFQTYDELYEAVIKQMQYFITLVRTTNRIAWNILRDIPLPFSSAVTNDCIKKGKDVTEGGARYSVGSGSSAVATIDAANCLAAIKKLVFEEKKITMKQLKEALEADYEGYEEVRQMCLDAPKYGNDDDYADPIAKELYSIFWKEHQKLPDFLGRPVKPEAFSVVAHFGVGRFTGALPNGRKARLPLTDASVSAQPGTDKNGPTALIRSASKVIDTVKFGGNHFNMKFHPSVFKDMAGRSKFLSLIKTYFDLGGYHVQFNCVSSETLEDAQIHPENYRDLVVRVAGFSAYFITLDKAVQDEIIKRTELSFRA